MMRIIYSLTVFLFSFTMVNNAFALKIAWFNPTKVLKNTSAGKRVLSKQRSLQKKFERERQQGGIPLAKEQSEIEKAWKNLQKNQSILTKQAAQQRMAKIKARYDAWMKKVQQYQAKMLKRQKELSMQFQQVASPFYKKLRKAAKQIAQQKGYDYIIAHDPDSPQLLLYANPSLNITKLIIRKIK